MGHPESEIIMKNYRPNPDVSQKIRKIPYLVPMTMFVRALS